MPPIIRNVHFEQSEDRIKIVYPAQRKPVWLSLYTILLIVWLIGLFWGIVFILRDVAFSGERFAIAFTIMLLVWLYIWYRLGRVVWQQWQYYAARREILYLEKDRLIIRRPVSLLGITDAYDMAYVSPFYFSSEENCPGFEYGSKRIYFARGLDEQSARRLVATLNEMQFGYDPYDEVDEI
ncbi:MAG: hypothetical protein ACK2UK_02960 [Candidatus Promineifilaceae bacterium]